MQCCEEFTVCVHAACHVERKAQHLQHQPSLVVCPPTLVGHWPHEVAKFVGSEGISIMQVRVPFSSPGYQ